MQLIQLSTCLTALTSFAIFPVFQFVRKCLTLFCQYKYISHARLLSIASVYKKNAHLRMEILLPYSSWASIVLNSSSSSSPTFTGRFTTDWWML